jgi:hypothetical protein
MIVPSAVGPLCQSISPASIRHVAQASCPDGGLQRWVRPVNLVAGHPGRRHPRGAPTGSLLAARSCQTRCRFRKEIHRGRRAGTSDRRRRYAGRWEPCLRITGRIIRYRRRVCLEILGAFVVLSDCWRRHSCLDGIAPCVYLPCHGVNSAGAGGSRVAAGPCWSV